MAFKHNTEIREFDELIGEDVFIHGFSGTVYLGVVEEIDSATSGHGDSPSFAICRLRDEETGEVVSERKMNCRRFK